MHPPALLCTASASLTGAVRRRLTPGATLSSAHAIVHNSHSSNSSSAAVAMGGTTAHHPALALWRLELQRLQLACAAAPLTREAQPHPRTGRPASTCSPAHAPLYASMPSLRRWLAAPLASAAAAAAPSAVWHTPHRHASTTRRPTFQEVAEALDVLGVGIDDDPKAVKKKYRELVKKNHPDAGGDAATMARVTVAYDRLSTLTNREREEFKMQKKVFHSGGGGGGARRYRPGPPGGYNYAAPNGPFQARAANMYGQYYQQDANTAYQQAHHAGQNSYWNQYHNRAGSAGFAENPFNFSNPFSMNAQAQRARFLPTGTLLIQGLVVYLVFSAFFLFLYRRYRDWRQDDGWRMSESLARHEQMQEMHRMRQEMNERARAMLARDGGADASLLPGANGLYGSRQYVGESPEARALEYARQRRIQMMQEQQDAAANAPELRGWPKIDEEKGRIIKRAQDPPGVVFFEPRREDTRRRQIENQRRASGFTRRTPQPTQEQQQQPQQPSVESSPAAATTVPVDNHAAATNDTGGNSSLPLPPESNVSSIVMKPVGSEQEAQAVMRGIFAGLRRSSTG